MEIKLQLGTETYFIEVTPQSYNATKQIVSQKGKNAGEFTRADIGFFTNVSNAVRKICQSHLSELDEVVTLKEYADRVQQSYKDLMAQVEI